MAELISTSTTVQELLSNGTGSEVPERYIHYKGGDSPSQEVTPILDIPVVDISCLAGSRRDEELEKLRSALNSCGCIQLINHGMTDSFVDQLHQVGKHFFALPMEEKLKYSRTADNVEGYGNDSVLSENQILDWTDRLFLTIHPQDQRQLNLWPQNPQTFREVLHEYTTNLKCLAETVFKAMAESLSVAENSFLDQYGEKASMIARFNFYPPCPRPDLTLGVKPHADGSAITFLLQDDQVEGLQVLKEDQWFRAPIVPHALLMNVGDQAEIMSNGVFKSPLHRVITNSERERMTVAVFCVPESDKEIGPIEELISEESPRLYKRMTNFVELYFKNYQHGRRPLILPHIANIIRDILHEYTTNMKSLTETVFKAMAGSLNLPENSFLDQYGENDSMLTIFNFYPPCPTPDLKLGAKVHTDGSAIKQVEGLQILKDKVEIMSNGAFKSPMHKVVTNSERETMTVTMFYMPDKEKEIGPIEELISKESPRLYKRITNFGGIRLNNSEQGWRPIDEVKL